MTTDEHQPAPQPGRAESHPHNMLNPEQHLGDAHGLAIQVQGKLGPTGRATWALVREEKGKAKTLTVFTGTRREAAVRFYDYIHPNKEEIPPPMPRRGAPGPRRSASAPPRGPRPQGAQPSRSQGGPPRPGGGASRPQGGREGPRKG